MTESHIPQFESPEPKRLQALSMRAAGMLLGVETKDPEHTMTALVTQVGGYSEATTGITDKSTLFVHDAAKQVPVGAAQDETTKQGHVMAYRTYKDFNDSKGADLSSAVSGTISKSRNSGEKATKVRGRIARKLTGYAVKGVGVQAHLRK